MNLVIVESPAKAKTINKYLGADYTVLASYGHIRDLPSKNGSVDPENSFKMIWEVDSFSKKYLKEITDTAKNSDKIILATDPDREGEAIAWHVKEFLDEKNKDEFTEDVFIATTGWLVKDNSLNDLVNLINEKYDVKLLGLASPLNFKSSKYKELRDYELGHVKEGVGAGGISLLAFLNGFKNDEIVSLCQENLEMMKGLGQISLEKDC